MQPRLTVKLATTYPIELYMMIQNWELLLTHVHEVILPSQPNLMLMSQVRREIDSLRTELTFDKGTKLVLLVSYATDEMIKITMKYPEVYFMDCTGRANRQRRDLFISVIRTPEGKCHMSNVTIIPSGRFSHNIVNDTMEILRYVLFFYECRQELGVSIYFQVHFSTILW